MSKVSAAIATVALMVMVGVLFIPGLTTVQLVVLLLSVFLAAGLEIRLIERKRNNEQNL